MFLKVFNNCKNVQFKRFNRLISSLPNDTKNVSLDDLKSKFSKLDKPNYYDTLVSRNKNLSKLKRASVLVPISIKKVLDENGLVVKKTFYTLTKRTEKMSSFKGHVCFIGGRRDSTDLDDSVTALREAKEEANIEEKSLTILAQLCPLITFNQTMVTPIVAYFDKQQFNPILSPNEVEMIFELPTERFLSNSNHTINSIRNEKGEYIVHFFKDNINGKKITTWGFTAFVSAVISSVIHAKTPEFDLDSNLKLDTNKQDLNEFIEKFSSNKFAISQENSRKNN